MNISRKNRVRIENRKREALVFFVLILFVVLVLGTGNLIIKFIDLSDLNYKKVENFSVIEGSNKCYVLIEEQKLKLKTEVSCEIKENQKDVVVEFAISRIYKKIIIRIKCSCQNMNPYIAQSKNSGTFVSEFYIFL